ncbi:MAG TPA: Crp/Fnr family transcriptional regulator [Solirubrobacteraceae bacterium]|jgi:CRP-like cAMP-binding protein
MRWALLDRVPADDVQRLLSIARRRKFERGEVVFHEQDPADTLHLIEKGRFAVRVSTPLGDRAILAVLGAGEMFGELALLGDEEDARRSATVVALEPAVTHSVHRLDFDGLRTRHPDTREVLVVILAAQVRRLSRQLLEALYVSADKRVVRRLVEAAEIYGDGEEAAVVPLTQEDLATLAGTSRATVNRVLRDQEARGFVKLGRGRTTVLDADALTARGR